MGKWTPGPWFWSRGVDDWELVGADANRVLFCWNDKTKWKSGLVIGENIKEADARLIAAAPELADALKLARDYMTDAIGERQKAFAGYEEVGGIPEMLAELAQVDAALAKAGVE